MYRKFILAALFVLHNLLAFSQNREIVFRTTDSSLQEAFDWAKNMALKYRGDSNDPAGPWYEAALPDRFAFCIRDVSHQAIGAEILGMSRENKNMIEKFIGNISESKDWCSFWEINKWNKPAPVDYKNDSAFWYNLNANFELIYACNRLYRWTGDTSYIHNPAFTYFCEKTLNDYINRWVLQLDSLLTRPSLPNLPAIPDKDDNYTKARGLPSYVENIEGIKMSADLLGAIYQGFLSYSSILQVKGEMKKSKSMKEKANRYLWRLKTDWWNSSDKTFYTYLKADKTFGEGEGALFLLWYDAIRGTGSRNAVIQKLISAKLNVESMSYLPYLFYKYGFGKAAKQYLLLLSNPATPRREYPEVSFGIVEGIVQGLMGIEPDAAVNTIRTCYRGDENTLLSISKLPVLNSRVKVEHKGNQTTIFTNEGGKTIHWEAGFKGKYKFLFVNGKRERCKTKTGHDGNILSYIVIPVEKQKIEISNVNRRNNKNAAHINEIKK